MPSAAFDAEVCSLAFSRLCQGLFSPPDAGAAELRRQEVLMGIAFFHALAHAAARALDGEAAGTGEVHALPPHCTDFVEKALPVLVLAAEAAAVSDPQMSSLALRAIEPLAKAAAAAFESKIPTLTETHGKQLLQILWTAVDAEVLEAAARLLLLRFSVFFEE